MLSAEDNRRLTEIGPGTPAGKLFRQYWLPVAISEQLSERNPLPLTVLGEKLVLFRDASGGIGLLSDRCAHRGASLGGGRSDQNTVRVEQRGIRCCYHGWLYGTNGQCLEQPGEPRSFAHKVKIASYPVQERYGFFWAFMGVGAPPALLPIDTLLRESGHRINVCSVWNCNYLQICENLVDPAHPTVLHKDASLEEEKFAEFPTVRAEPTQYGIRMLAGRTGYMREVEMLFPSGIRLFLPLHGFSVETVFWVLPVHDTLCHSFHSWFMPLPETLPELEREAKVRNLERFVYGGEEIKDRLYGATKLSVQDKYACASQGQISDRTVEHLGLTDVGVVMLRKLLKEAIRDVEEGRMPRGAFKTAPASVIDFSNVQ